MRSKIVPWAFFVVALVLAVISFPLLPETIACQWDVNGNVSNEVGKWGVFFPTIIMVLLMLRNNMRLQNKDVINTKVLKYIYHSDGARIILRNIYDIV